MTRVRTPMRSLAFACVAFAACIATTQPQQPPQPAAVAAVAVPASKHMFDLPDDAPAIRVVRDDATDRTEITVRFFAYDGRTTDVRTTDNPACFDVPRGTKYGELYTAPGSPGRITLPQSCD